MITDKKEAGLDTMVELWLKRYKDLDSIPSMENKWKQNKKYNNEKRENKKGKF